MKWDFRERKKYILENCSQPDWAGYNEDPILEKNIDRTIYIANRIKDFFDKNGIEIEQPSLMPCGNGSLDLNWDNFEKGYEFLYHHDKVERDSCYGNNSCRNWKNDKKIEIIVFNTQSSRIVLGTFAKWCFNRKNLDWSIEVEK